MATTGYASALGGLAKDAVIGAGKGFVGGLKGAMMSEAPGITGAYAFGKELRKRANAPKMSSGGSAPPSAANKPSSSSPMAGGLGITNDKSIVAGLRQSNIINLEQIRQLKQLNDNVINQSKLLKFTVDDTKRKDQFAEEVAKEQAFRDDELLEAIRNIGAGGAGGTKQAANDSSSGGFLSNLLGSLAGGAATTGISKLVPILTAFAAAMPWARILGIAARLSGPALAAANAIPGSNTPKPAANSNFIKNTVDRAKYEKAIIEAQKRAAEDATDKPRPLDYVPVGNNPASFNNQREKQNTKIRQDIWDKENRGKRDPISGKRFDNLSNMPASGIVTSVFTDSPDNERESTTPGMSKNHKGVDIGMPGGSPVFSILRGTVKSVEVDGGVPDPVTGAKSGLGRFVEVQHAGGLVTKYAHLRSVNVTRGQEVGPGILLGTSGGDTEDRGSGASTGQHLHFETISEGKHVNPAVIPGLEALGVKNSNVLLAAAAVGAPISLPVSAPPAASKASGGTHDSMKPAGYSPDLLGGGAKLVSSRPLEEDFPALQKLAEERQKEEELNKLIKEKLQRETGLKLAEGMPAEEFGDLAGKNKTIKEYKDKIKEIDKKIILIREGAKAVAPKNISTNPKIDAKKILIDALEEFQRTILKGIQDYKNIVGDSNSAVDSNFIAGYNLNSPLFANQTNIQENPNAYVTAGHLFGIAKVTSDAGGRGGKAVIDLNAGDSAKDYDKFHKIENRRIDENIARIEDERKREFLTSEKSSYTTAGVEVSKESNPLVAFIERLLLIFRGERSSSVKLDSSYFDNTHVNDLFRKSERDFRVESDKLASGTILDKGPISVEDEALLKELIKNNKVLKGTGGPAKLLPSYVDKSGKQLPTKVDPPFKPNFRGNTQILAEANKQFLNELRSTFTGLARKGLQDALLPNGVGVSFAQASQDNLFRGEQLKQINDTSKKINEGAIKLFGNKFGPMFAPMLDKLSTSYFEVGSRLVGRQLFTRFGGLDDKETMGITGQVLGNIAAGKKQLAAEQLLFGMSGGRERGIALNAESLFAKYGFEDSQQGISYFADVLGEKATQPFSKVFGADDRNKSIVRDPRSGKLVYTDSGKEASKEDIKAGYGGRISQTPLLGKENEYMEVPGYPGSVAGTGGPNDQYAIYDEKGKIIGRKAGGMTNSSVTGGSFSAEASRGTGMPMQQYAKVQGNNPTQADLLGITSKQFNSDLEKNTLLAEAQIALMKQKEREDRKLAAEAIKAEAKFAADAEIAAGNISKAEIITAEAAKKANDIVTMDSAVVVADAVKQAGGGGKDGAGSGSNTPGLKASGRRPGQLFDANVYGDGGKITGKDPMKEIGNFGFDILKLAAGSELTKGISNPYLQTITNFAIQKGMNSAIDAIMDSNIFSKMGSAASSSSSYGGIGDAFSWISNLWPFKDGGLVQRHQTGGLVVGAGTGTSDSIPAMLSNGEFVVNAHAYAANKALVNAINQSTLPKKTTSGSGTYIDDRGGGYDEGRGPTVGSPGGPDALGIGPASDRSALRDMVEGINSIHPVVSAILGFIAPPFGVLTTGAKLAGWAIDKANVAASNVMGGQSQTMSQAKGVFRGMEIRDQNDTESSGSRNFGKESSIPQGGIVSPGVTSGGRDGNGALGNSGSGAGTSNGGAQAEGGLITGKGSGTSDSIFSMLSNGEFVINAKATKANLALLKQINSYSGSGSVPKSEYDSNLSIEPFKNTFKGFADGGLVAAANKSSTMNAVPRPTSRSPYILSPPTNNSSSENQNNSSNMIIGPKTSTRIDNSSVTNFYNQASGMIDSIRSITPQVA